VLGPILIFYPLMFSALKAVLERDGDMIWELLSICHLRGGRETFEVLNSDLGPYNLSHERLDVFLRQATLNLGPGVNT